MTTRMISSGVLFALGFLLVLGQSRPPDPETFLASVNSSGTSGGNGASGILGAVISADGHFVAFESDASDLVANDTNGTTDVFVRDLKSGTTTLVSINSAGTGSGNDVSRSPALSADGRFVCFVSEASNLVANDTNGTLDVFVRDLETGTTTLVSINSAGTASGNDRSGDGFHGAFETFPVISGDGRFVAFQSNASDLVANDSNGFADVFVRDRGTGTTTLVSVNRDGTGSGRGISVSPAMSADGRFVAFVSTADGLVEPTLDVSLDVYVRDLGTGATSLVSVNRDGTGGGNDFSRFAPAISADGRFVAFESEADNLVANDRNFRGDVFVRDLQTGTTTMASVSIAGTDGGNERSGDFRLPVMSADGRFVAFESDASDLVPHDTNGIGKRFPVPDVFVRDLLPGTTTLVSVNSTGTASGNFSSGRPSISASGRFVAFDSGASDLVANDTNTTGDVYVRDLLTGRTTLVSVNRAGAASANQGSFSPVISANGHSVAFSSRASDLVANDTNSNYDVFVRFFGASLLRRAGH